MAVSCKLIVLCWLLLIKTVLSSEGWGQSFNSGKYVVMSILSHYFFVLSLHTFLASRRFICIYICSLIAQSLLRKTVTS